MQFGLSGLTFVNHQMGLEQCSVQAGLGSVYQLHCDPEVFQHCLVRGEVVAGPCLWEPWPLPSPVLASGSSQPGHILPCVSCPVGLGQLLPTQWAALSSPASPELQLPWCPGASADLLLVPSLHLVLEAISGQ